MGCLQSSMKSSVTPAIEGRNSLRVRGGKEYVSFVSHFKMEAATDARLLQMELEKILQRKVFLDSDDLKDLTQLSQHVTNDCECLLLVQSSGVLTRPYCLLELYRAIEGNVPIIGVNLRGQFAYNFEKAYRFLLHLDTALEQANPGATEVLKDNGVDITEVAYKLSSRLPNIISIEYNSCASRNVLTATIADIADNIKRCLDASYETPALPTRSEWETSRAANPYEVDDTAHQNSRTQKKTQHGVVTDGACDLSPRSSIRESVKLSVGSGILQLAKSPIPGLAPLAFLLKGISTATSKAVHLVDDCEMFAAICEHLEQVLIEHGEKLRLHKDRDELVKSISDLLQKGLAQIKPLANSNFDTSQVDFTVFPNLCGTAHDVASRLEAVTRIDVSKGQNNANLKPFEDGQSGALFSTNEKAGAMQQQAQMITTMRKALDEQQTKTDLHSQEKKIMELQNRLLEERVSQMNALMEKQRVQMEEFMRLYPTPANEADRLLTIAKYDMENLPLPIGPVEDVLTVMRSNEALAPGLERIFVNLLDEHKICTIANHMFFDLDDSGEQWHSLFASLSDGFKFPPFPKKFSSCQYVVATGQMQCGVSGGNGEMDQVMWDLQQKIAHVPVLAEVDPGMNSPALAWLSDPDSIPFEREKKFFKKLIDGMGAPGFRYSGAPIQIDGHAIGTVCCVHRIDLENGEREPSQEQMTCLHDSAEKISAALIDMSSKKEEETREPQF